MNKLILRDVATSASTVLFLVIGISGLMMFFHFFDNYVKELHEILGVGFVLAVLLHIIANFSSMKKYFSKKIL